ncbi:hypothetical protein HYE67_010232 [Fusarium culmorum]|uniref:CFEM domain-containing protein n=1 Tax=Fusarium culmorum TaxID=5516 RepID=A0A2T4H5Q9_FUSCU|nr:hypothetical protein FCULG_00011259 [Fusarium culmorum]QPC68001.1 hypothetical protein HYE67_010232 [Fusarium culmorum]
MWNKIPCALEAFSSGGSNQTVQDICKNKSMQNRVTYCVNKVCSLKEGLEFEGTVASICNVPTRDDRQMFRYIIIVFALFSFTFVFLRVASRLIVKTPWGPDDTWAMIAFVLFLTWPLTIGIDDGFGSFALFYSSGTDKLLCLLKITCSFGR